MKASEKAARPPVEVTVTPVGGRLVLNRLTARACRHRGPPESAAAVLARKVLWQCLQPQQTREPRREPCHIRQPGELALFAPYLAPGGGDAASSTSRVGRRAGRAPHGALLPNGARHGARGPSDNLAVSLAVSLVVGLAVSLAEGREQER